MNGIPAFTVCAAFSNAFLPGFLRIQRSWTTRYSENGNQLARGLPNSLATPPLTFLREARLRHAHPLTLPLIGALSVLTLVATAEDPAAHPAFSDLRIEGSLLPDTFDVDGTATGPLGSVSRSGSEEFHDAWRIGVIAMSARANDSGLVAFGSGGGLQYSRWHDDEDVDETVEALAATLRLGIVIHPTAVFHLEATPYGSIGVARGKIDDQKSDTAFYWEAGGMVGAFMTFGGFQVGAHLGYLWNGTKLKFDSDANYPVPVESATVTLKGEGTFFGVSLGGRF